MATQTQTQTTQNLTEVKALELAAAMAAAQGETVLADKLAHMASVKAKHSSAKRAATGPTAEQRRRAADARALALFFWGLADDARFGAKALLDMGAVEGATSSQRISSLAALCISEGWLVRCADKSRTVYARGDVDPRA